jgi:dihydrofolate synthase / folylpolyglutamate synthase
MSTPQDANDIHPSPAERGLEAAWGRLEGLIDWERRSRKPGKRGQAMRVDLEPIRDLTRLCGTPQRGRRFVHVTGTKGKGSVAALVACGMAARGLRVLRYGSPHVERLHERVTIYEPRLAERQQGGAPLAVGFERASAIQDGSAGVQVPSDGIRHTQTFDVRAVSDAELALALHRALDARESAIAAQTPGLEATWFDVLTCAALLVMRALEIEWGVFECGLGGRLDSTNVIDGEVCVLTNVDLEHTDVLGPTCAHIAREKVAIAKRGATLVTGVRQANQELAVILQAHVREEAGDLIWALDDSDSADASEATGPANSKCTAPPGSLAATNAVLATAVLRALERRGVLADANTALSPDVRAAAVLPGRMEVLSWQGLPVVLDGAHVPSSLAAVLTELSARTGLERPPVTIFGVGKDKDVDGLLKVLGAQVDRLFCTSVGSQTAAPLEELVENAKRFVVEVKTASTPRIAFDQAALLCGPGDWILVTGSLHLVGAIRPLLRATPQLP